MRVRDTSHFRVRLTGMCAPVNKDSLYLFENFITRHSQNISANRTGQICTTLPNARMY